MTKLAKKLLASTMPRQPKAIQKTFSFDEIMKIMDEEIAGDTTPRSDIDWRELDHLDSPDDDEEEPEWGS